MQKLICLSFLFLYFFATAQQRIDVITYRFEIELSDKSDAITGTAAIGVRFLADAAQVRFDLASITDDKGMYAFQVMENGVLLRSTHTDDIVTITLASPAKAGDMRTFTINYMGTPRDGLIISQNKYGDRTFFADNWPNRAHQWLPCNDHPDDKAAVEFFITAPSHYKVVSNGSKLQESKIDGDRKLTYWREERPLPTKVMVIAAAPFAVKEFVDSSSPVPVSAWVFPQDSTKGFYDYGVAPSIVHFFSDYIGPFPYKKLANVQSKTIFGGMENAGAIFYAEESVTGDRKWEDVMAHEIAHQWFGDMATEKSFAHLWLSEGFATYLTDIYMEAKYGRDSALNRLKKERDEVIAFAASSNRPVVDSTSDLMSLLNANSYQKGAWVLHMLRNEVGDSVFRNILRTYYGAYKGSNAETSDFETVAQMVAQKDLQWFFYQWLHRPGVPELKVDTKIDRDDIKIFIRQQKEPYRFTMEARILFADGRQNTVIIPVSQKETEFKMKAKGAVRIVLDPQTKLLFAEK